MKPILLFSALCCLAASGASAQNTGAVAPNTGTSAQNTWHGYARYDFVLDEATGSITPFTAPAGERDGVGDPAKGQRRCVLVMPKQAAPGNPWSWQGCYWNHQPQTEIELLHRGFCIAYISASATLPPDKNWETWYAFLTDKYKLSPYPAFVGMSRGGIFAYQWATTHPDAVSCIYADNPAISPESLAKLDQLASRDVPLLNVCGSIDPLLGYHTLAIESIYRQLGGRITVMIKEGYGHHPHSLRDATPLADWIEQNWKTVHRFRTQDIRASAVPPAGYQPPRDSLLASLMPTLAQGRWTHTYYYGNQGNYTWFPSEGTYITCRGPWFTGCYDRYQLNLTGIDGAVTVTVPVTPAPGKPWVLRVGFSGADAYVDLALLAKGYAIVTGPSSYNSDSLSLKDWDAVYGMLVQDGFSSKPVLEGSGGAGGQAYGWAIANPEKVACIYVENPFLRNTFSPAKPLDNLAPLARAHVPILHLCGSLEPTLADQTRVAEKRYQQLGGSMKVIVLEGKGHEGPGAGEIKPVVSFIDASTGH